MKIEQIKTAEPFKGLFPIERSVLDRVQEDMQRHGYDPTQPLILWAEQGVVVDGHTRLAAARNLALEEVPVYEKSFADQDEALAYAIHNQRDRRNLSEAELLRCIEAVDKRRERGGDRRSEDAKSKGANAPIERSAEITANIVGTSPDKVKRARSVLSDPKEKESVMAGKKSINQASKDAKAKRKSRPPSPPPEPYSGALYFTNLALSQLSRIRDEDPKRVEAIQRVQAWVNEELSWSLKINGRKDS
jgi:ParB-like chromosome segregation protein Spo0J